jgi:hypothetical protein
MNKLLVTVSFLFIGNFMYAQKQDSIKELPSEQVEVIKQFEARLEDARKVNIIPEPPAQRVLEKFDYNVNIRPILLDYPEPQIKPIPIQPTPKEKSFHGYSHLGIGNLNTIDGAFAYSFVTNQDTEFGLMADYLTMKNTKERFQNIQTINAAANISHYLSSLATVSAKLNYHQEDVGFFGSIFDPSVLDTSIYQRSIIDYGFGFGLSNLEENEYDIDYNLNFEFKNISLADENLFENNFLIDGALSKDINQQVSFNLAAKADISTINDTTTLNYNNYTIQPSFFFSTDLLSIDAGVNFAFADTNIYYLPQIEINYNAYEDKIVPFVYWKANLQKNNLFALLDYNPYLVNDLTGSLQNTIANKYGLGAKGHFQNLYYKADIGFGRIDNLVLFRNNLGENGLRQFKIELDTSTILDLNLEANYHISKSLSVFAGFNFIDYSITAWHLPSYTFNAAATYRLLKDKLTLEPSLFIRDGLTVRNDESEIEELPYMLDLSIHANYQVAKQFSVFGEVNNLLASEYQYWYDYSNFGINVKIGVRAKF